MPGFESPCFADNSTCIRPVPQCPDILLPSDAVSVPASRIPKQEESAFPIIRGMITDANGFNCCLHDFHSLADRRDRTFRFNPACLEREEDARPEVPALPPQPFPAGACAWKQAVWKQAV
eukprot:gene12811-biopygen9487